MATLDKTYHLKVEMRRGSPIEKSLFCDWLMTINLEWKLIRYGLSCS